MRSEYIYSFALFFLFLGCGTYKPAIKVTYKPLGRSTYYYPPTRKTETIRSENKQEYHRNKLLDESTQGGVPQGEKKIPLNPPFSKVERIFPPLEKGGRGDLNRRFPDEPVKKVQKPIVKKEPVRGYVNANRVRVRKGPSEEAYVLTHLNADTPVEILTDNARNGWVQVQLEKSQVEGWIWSAYIDIPGLTSKTRSRHSESNSFALPLREAVITDAYGVRRSHPVNGGRGKMHTGVDLRATYGTPVFAISTGVVVAALKDYYYGEFIDLDNGNGIRSRYAHLSKLLVGVGQHVEKGERIALTGDSGQTTGPHLHFELWINGQAVDPADYIKFSR